MNNCTIVGGPDCIAKEAWRLSMDKGRLALPEPANAHNYGDKNQYVAFHFSDGSELDCVLGMGRFECYWSAAE